MNEPSSTGTRVAKPSNRPTYWGETSKQGLDGGRGRWNDIGSGRPRPADIGMRSIDNTLIVGKRMNRVHKPVFKAKSFIHNLQNRSQTIGGARSV